MSRTTAADAQRYLSNVIVSLLMHSKPESVSAASLVASSPTILPWLSVLTVNLSEAF